jgi:hypothetical protein
MHSTCGRDDQQRTIHCNCRYKVAAAAVVYLCHAMYIQDEANKLMAYPYYFNAPTLLHN